MMASSIADSLQAVHLQSSEKVEKKEYTEITPQPEFISHRIKLFEQYKARYDAFVAQQPRLEIKVALPDGKSLPAIAWETTPMAIAKQISNSLADRLVIARVDGELWDTVRPLEGDCSLELLDFEHPDGKQVFWHSSAHVLGEACERSFGCHLCIGPPLEEGFYYEMKIPANHKVEDSILASSEPGLPITPADYPNLNALAKAVVKEKQPFERLELSKPELLEMFKHNPFKVHLIQNKLADVERTTVYRCGPLIDLCRGPHIPHTGRIKAIQVTRSSSSYFLADSAYASLQRVYGISFPETALMKEYLKGVEEADKRDHRKVGKDQQLFFFHEYSPGCAFFLPHGARVFNRLINFLQGEYRKRGFTEVITPNLFNVSLWKQSGHWDNYRENMFAFNADKHGDHRCDEGEQQPQTKEEGTTFALKPMNCPGHCLMFAHRERSYRELPIRFADFGVLHRNELSGTLGGLTRVRRFQQDDAHIFCRPDQIESEIEGCLDFLRHVYGIFGYQFSLVLSTRPDKYLGELSQWEQAEKQLASAMDRTNMKWELNPGDGAFYGPKIDISIQDAHKRKHQCATIQLDFQLPIRFNLTYRGPDEAECRPVILHRAILGSLERQFAILTEHFAGDWPFWLSPRQVAVIPVSPANNAYAEKLAALINERGFYSDADVSGATLNKKIRNAELAPYKFIVVLGAKEEANNTVNVRKAVKQGEELQDIVLDTEEFLCELSKLSDGKSLSPFIKA